ncbi:DUF2804 domain-containing protein [Nocardioides jensenii]|uniref:DUF2804 domain-containing protein n=1 Tax=Nocardioides jensenii TaxID=1843 RepID=UPI0008298F83|nr:DUF2804 domain-containing protein [Nocardioides jensenii]
MPRELTEPIDLCLPDGTLDPAAVGWSRTPLHHANLQGWGRNKRWEYWGIVTPVLIVGVVVSSLDYAGVHSLYVLDRRTGREWAPEVVVPFARGVVLPEVSGSGPVRGVGRGFEIGLVQDSGGVTLKAAAPELELDLRIPAVPDRDCLAVVVPWSARRFQYTVKDVGRPVSGHIRVAGTTYDVSPADSFAVLDHGRGKWPYSMRWNWAAGSRPGGDLAIQLGGAWTDGTGQTENGLFVDGRLHKIHEDLRWVYDRDDWMAPWRIEGKRVQVAFTPFHERVAKSNLMIVAGETHQCFGHFTGWASTDEGEQVSLDGLTGWAEEAHNRW